MLCNTPPALIIAESQCSSGGPEILKVIKSSKCVHTCMLCPSIQVGSYALHAVTVEPLWSIQALVSISAFVPAWHIFLWPTSGCVIECAPQALPVVL